MLKKFMESLFRQPDKPDSRRIYFHHSGKPDSPRIRTAKPINIGQPQHEETWILICPSCGKKYVLGDDSDVVTDERMYGRLKPKMVIDVGGGSRGPDIVVDGLKPDAKSEVLNTVRRIKEDIRRGDMHRWVCSACQMNTEHSNPYPSF